MEQIIVLLDDNGSALGAVYVRQGSFILVDSLGKKVKEVTVKMTVKEAKNILLHRKLNYII